MSCKRTEQRRVGASDPEIERARALYGSNDIEIDSGADVSIADNGVWVQAWVWLPLTSGSPPL